MNTFDNILLFGLRISQNNLFCTQNSLFICFKQFWRFPASNGKIKTPPFTVSVLHTRFCCLYTTCDVFEFSAKYWFIVTHNWSRMLSVQKLLSKFKWFLNIKTNSHDQVFKKHKKSSDKLFVFCFLSQHIYTYTHCRVFHNRGRHGGHTPFHEFFWIPHPSPAPLH